MRVPLRELQREVLDALFGRSQRACRHVADSALAPRQRLQVYGHSMFEGLTAALQAVFPTVERLVGERFFRHLACRFVEAHPSRSGNLHDYGGELPGFVERFEPAAGVPYLADVARLEWAWHTVFHSEAQPACDALEVLGFIAAAAPDERAGLRLPWQPAAALVASPWPVLTIWQWHQREPGEGELELASGGEAALVVQQAGDVQLHALAPGEHALLHALSRGAALGEAVQEALALDAPLDLGAALLRALQLGALLDPAQPG